MKTMLWMRHGKSDWGADYGADHDRPLATRGIDAARSMGRALDRAGLAPDAILTSTALRARSTAELAAQAGGWDVELLEDRGLYASSVERVLDVVRERIRGDEVDTLWIVGHEPTWSSAVSALVGGGSFRMVTAAVACVDLEISRWGELRPGLGELRWLVPPKLLAKLEE